MAHQQAGIIHAPPQRVGDLVNTLSLLRCGLLLLVNRLITSLVEEEIFTKEDVADIVACRRADVAT